MWMHMYVSAVYKNVGAHHLIPFAHFEVIVFLSQTPHDTGKNLTVLPKAPKGSQTTGRGTLQLVILRGTVDSIFASTRFMLL